MTKLADIARALDLDVSVISRALSRSPKNRKRVNEETRKRIQETARKMNYVPDRSAVFFRQKKAPTILCFLPGYVERLLGGLVVGISEEASRQKFPVNFFFGRENADYENFCEALNRIKHSGVITYPPPKMTNFMRAEIEKYHKNGGHVLILNACSNEGIGDERFEGIPQLQINDCYGGRLVARHFMERGAEVFFRSEITAVYEFRHQGFRDTLRTAGYTDLEFSIDAFLGEYGKGKKIGVFGLSDTDALNVMLQLELHGLLAGRDYLLSGFDDQYLSETMTPSLTTIHQPTREEGVLAVKKIIRLVEGEKAESEFLNPWLTVRETTGGKRSPFGTKEIIY